MSIKPDLFFRDKLRTYDETPTGLVSYILSVPNTAWFQEHVANVLLALTVADNWEQIGSVSVEDALDLASGVFMSFNPMIGFIFPVVWDEIPPGYLECDGGVHQRVFYPRLYNLLDPAFIIDADTFKLPDLAGRTIIGANVPFPVGSTGGEINHQLTLDELASHTHTYSGDLTIIPGGETSVLANVTNPLASFTGANGGDLPHNNMQPYQAIRYVIACDR